jgi:hypothetical protein
MITEFWNTKGKHETCQSDQFRSRYELYHDGIDLRLLEEGERYKEKKKMK